MTLNRWMRAWIVFSIAWVASWLFFWAAIINSDYMGTGPLVVLSAGPALVYAIGYAVAWVRRGA
jgi:hypothetical protein